MEVIYVLILLTVLVSMLIQWRLLDILKRLSRFRGWTPSLIFS